MSIDVKLAHISECMGERILEFSLLALCILLEHQHTLLVQAYTTKLESAFTDLNNNVIHPAAVVHCLN